MTIFDYLERQLSTFDEEPFNPVDSALLTQFCMTRIAPAATGGDTEGGAGNRTTRPAGTASETEGAAASRADVSAAEAVPSPAADTPVPATMPSADTPAVDAPASAIVARMLQDEPIHFSDLLDTDRFGISVTGPQTGDVERELGLLAASPRFQELEIRDYVEVFDEATRTQFAAMTFTWRDEWAYVGFRGTDGSFAGWRENFDMAMEPPVGCQRLAVEYVGSVARHLPHDLLLGGHSKGGNVATYAALRCEADVRDRIVRVYDHDGPGFKPGFIPDEEFDALGGRIWRTVPVDDVVGQIMDTPATTHAVESQGRGFDQHSVFAWDVAEGLDDFVYAPELSNTARTTHQILDEWLASFTDDELPRVIDAVFDTIEASGVTRVGEFFEGSSSVTGLVIEMARKLEPEKRELVMPALTSFMRIATKATAQGAGRAAKGAARDAREKLQNARPARPVTGTRRRGPGNRKHAGDGSAADDDDGPASEPDADDS